MDLGVARRLNDHARQRNEEDVDEGKVQREVLRGIREFGLN